MTDSTINMRFSSRREITRALVIVSTDYFVCELGKTLQTYKVLVLGSLMVTAPRLSVS